MNSDLSAFKSFVFPPVSRTPPHLGISRTLWTLWSCTALGNFLMWFIYQVSKASDWFTKARCLSSNPGSRLDSCQQPGASEVCLWSQRETRLRECVWICESHPTSSKVNPGLPPTIDGFRRVLPLCLNMHRPGVTTCHGHLILYMQHCSRCPLLKGQADSVVSCRGWREAEALDRRQG